MPDIFEPGQKAMSSGVFKAVHANNHVPPHYVTVVYGDVFPN
jgi:hypothetical protein